LKALESDIVLSKITDFFTLFPAIYALTSTPENVAIATRAVLEDFLLPVDGRPPQCTYLELRTTPRSSDSMSKMQYLQAVLGEMDKFPAEQCNLIVSVDWRMSAEQALETVNLAIELFNASRRVVGIDICGDFQVKSCCQYFPTNLFPISSRKPFPRISSRPSKSPAGQDYLLLCT
jgi:adenosine deaminase